MIIDEIQRGGDDLVRALKMVVDRSQARGQFVLSGSTSFLTVPTLSESLAGRAVFIDLWPLSMAERTGNPLADPIRDLFTDPATLIGTTSDWKRADYIDVVAAGGYPEAVQLPLASLRRTWFDSYVSTVINRDINDFAKVVQGPAMHDLLKVVAARSGSSWVLSNVADTVGLNRETVKQYLSYLEMVFLIAPLPVWSGNLTSRIAKTPKVYVTDSGLAAHLLETTADDLNVLGHPETGRLVETFVVNEIRRLATTSSIDCWMGHYRDRDKREVDIVLEGPNRRIVAIEVKASASPSPADTVSLRWLRDKVGDRFGAGVLLHLGERALSFGDGIYSLPVSTLWGHAPLPG